MAARATVVHRKNQEEMERVKRPKLSMPDLPTTRGTVIRQPAKNRGTSSSKGKGPAQRKYSLRSSGGVAAASADSKGVPTQLDSSSGTIFSGHTRPAAQPELSDSVSTPCLVGGGEGQGGVGMLRSSEACEPLAPRKRKQGMPGLIGVSGDAPVMAALDTPPPQQAFSHQLPNAALAVGSGICPPPPFIMAAPVVILSPSAPVPTITATQPRVIPHHSLPHIEQSPFTHATTNFGYNPPPLQPQQHPSNTIFGSSFHGNAGNGFHGNSGALDPFNSGVIHLSPSSYTRGVPSLLQTPPRPLLTYARGDNTLLNSQTPSVPEEFLPPFPHMPRPHQVGRRQGVVLSSAEHEHMMQQLDPWQEGGADSPTRQQHLIPSTVASSSLSQLAYQGSTPVFPPPGSQTRPYFPQFTAPTQFRPPVEMSIPVSRTPPPNYESDIIVLSDSSNEDESNDPATPSYHDLAFARRWRHEGPPIVDEGAGQRSRSPPFLLSGSSLLSHGRGAPIPSFSLGAARRASLPTETTSDRSEQQMMEDAELARRLQMEEYGMMTPPTMPLPQPTFDREEEERMRSSPFPHYDPDQHPWAPSPPSQLPSRLPMTHQAARAPLVHRTARAPLRATRLRRQGTVQPPEPVDVNDPAHVTNNWSDLSRRARNMSRMDARRFIRNALLLRGRSQNHASSRVIRESIRSLPPGMLVMAMTMELGYEHLLELADLLGPGRPAGLSQEELDQIPVKKYKVQTTGSSGSDSIVEKCIVCLCEYEEGDLLRNLKCGHDFHRDCIDQWLQGNATCPVCRSNAKNAATGPGSSSSIN